MQQPLFQEFDIIVFVIWKQPVVSCFSQDVKNAEIPNDRGVPNEPANVPDSAELIAPGTPIQFDIVLPAMEFLDQNRGGRYS